MEPHDDEEAPDAEQQPDGAPMSATHTTDLVPAGGGAEPEPADEETPLLAEQVAELAAQVAELRAAGKETAARSLSLIHI